RKEIKNLQQAAKCLAVSSTVFSDTRLKLSKCWDQLKGLEKEIRQEQSRLRVASAENSKDVREQLAGIAQVLEEGGDLFRIRKDLDAAAKRIRSLDLIHDDVVALKAELQVLFEKLKEKQDAAEQVYQEQLARDKQIRQEAIKELTEKIKLFSERCTSGDIHSETRSEWQELKESLTKAAFLSASERISLDNRLNLTLQHITAYFEEQLLSSPDSREKLTNMRQVLSQRQERRKELKDKLEQDKKLLGSSGLDFDRAMQYSALVEEDKRALEELDQSILDLKRQIQQLT
ncbi:putative myosin heavy chain, partial [Chlamydia psittaci 02DC24]